MAKRNRPLLDESLSVLIPTLNEENNIESVIRDSLYAVEKFSNDYEIVIVDGGSTDRTVSKCKEICRHHSRVKLVKMKSSRGLGDALKKGVKACNNDIIIYIEGDGQSMLKDQASLLRKIKHSDVVLGVRSARSDYTLLRKVMSAGYIIASRVILGLRFKDLNWSQAYRRNIFNKISVNSVSPFFTTEVPYRAIKSGLIVNEAPTKYKPRKGGVTSLGNLKTARAMLHEMILLRLGII